MTLKELSNEFFRGIKESKSQKNHAHKGSLVLGSSGIPSLTFHYKPTGLSTQIFSKTKKKPSLSIGQFLSETCHARTPGANMSQIQNPSVLATACFNQTQASPAGQKVTSSKRKLASSQLREESGYKDKSRLFDDVFIDSITSAKKSKNGKPRTGKKGISAVKARNALHTHAGFTSSAKDAGGLERYLSSCKKAAKFRPEPLSSCKQRSKLKIEPSEFEEDASANKPCAQLVKKLSFQAENISCTSPTQENTDFIKQERGINSEIDELLENLIMVKRQHSPASPKIKPNQLKLLKTSYKNLVSSMLLMENKRRDAFRPISDDNFMVVRSNLLKLLSILTENFQSTEWVYFNAINILDSAAFSLKEYLKVAQCALMISLKMQQASCKFDDLEVLRLENKVIQVCNLNSGG